MVSGIYAFIRKGTDDMYIGSSNDIPKRLHQHFSQLRRGKHHSKYMQRVYDKYGADILEVKVLEYTAVDKLIEREQYYLDLYQPVFNSNKEAGRTVIYGRKMSDEQKAKMKATNAAKKAAGIKRHRNPMSEETKLKIKNAQAGKPREYAKKPRSEDTKRKISEAQKGKPRPWQRKNEVSL